MPNSLEGLITNQSLQWLFVGGKGGVGKTTTSCAIAIQMAKTRESVLLLSTDPAHNISDALGQKFSGEPQKVKDFDNLYAMEIDPQKSSNPFSTDATESLSMFGDTEENRGLMESMSELVKNLPGIDEAMSFAEMMTSVKKMKFSLIVFDTAPTGHTLRLLGFPKLIDRAFDLFSGVKDKMGGMLGAMPGNPFENMGDSINNIQDTSKHVQEIFSNPDKCSFVCVCIPEFLSVYETERLVQELTVKQEIDVSNIVVNQILMPSESECAKCEMCDSRRRIQRKYLEHIDELYSEDFSVVPMGLQLDEVRGKKALDLFGQTFTRESDVTIRSILDSRI